MQTAAATSLDGVCIRHDATCSFSKHTFWDPKCDTPMIVGVRSNQDSTPSYIRLYKSLFEIDLLKLQDFLPNPDWMKHSWICIDESCSLHTSPRNSTEMQLHCQIVSFSKPCRILRFPPGSREPCIASNIFRSFSFSSRSSRIRRSSARNAWLPRG